MTSRPVIPRTPTASRRGRPATRRPWRTRTPGSTWPWWPCAATSCRPNCTRTSAKCPGGAAGPLPRPVASRAASRPPGGWWRRSAPRTAAGPCMRPAHAVQGVCSGPAPGPALIPVRRNRSLEGEAGYGTGRSPAVPAARRRAGVRPAAVDPHGCGSREGTPVRRAGRPVGGRTPGGTGRLDAPAEAIRRRGRGPREVRRPSTPPSCTMPHSELMLTKAAARRQWLSRRIPATSRTSPLVQPPNAGSREPGSREQGAGSRGKPSRGIRRTSPMPAPGRKPAQPVRSTSPGGG